MLAGGTGARPAPEDERAKKERPGQGQKDIAIEPYPRATGKRKRVKATPGLPHVQNLADNGSTERASDEEEQRVNAHADARVLRRQL